MRPCGGAAGGAYLPVRRREAFVEAGNFAPDAGRQQFIPGQRLGVDVVLVVCPGEFACGRLETRSHLLEIALDLVVGLSQCAGAPYEERYREPDAHESGGPIAPLRAQTG